MESSVYVVTLVVCITNLAFPEPPYAIVKIIVAGGALVFLALIDGDF